MADRGGGGGGGVGDASDGNIVGGRTRKVVQSASPTAPVNHPAPADAIGR